VAVGHGQGVAGVHLAGHGQEVVGVHLAGHGQAVADLVAHPVVVVAAADGHLAAHPVAAAAADGQPVAHPVAVAAALYQPAACLAWVASLADRQQRRPSAWQLARLPLQACTPAVPSHPWPWPRYPVLPSDLTQAG
jgi:hypothetical protein